MRINLQSILFNLINLIMPKSLLKTKSCNIFNVLNVLVLFALTISISIFLNIPIAVTANISVSAPISGFSGKVTPLLRRTNCRSGDKHRIYRSIYYNQFPGRILIRSSTRIRILSCTHTRNLRSFCPGYRIY